MYVVRQTVILTFKNRKTNNNLPTQKLFSMKSANFARIKILPLIKTFLMGKHFAALFTPIPFKYTPSFQHKSKCVPNFNHPRKMPVILSKIYSFFRHALHVIIFPIFISTDILFLLFFLCGDFQL